MIPIISILLFGLCSFWFIRGRANWFGILAPKVWVASFGGCILLFAFAFSGDNFYDFNSQQSSLLIFIELYFFLVSFIIAMLATMRKVFSGFLGGFAATSGIYLPGILISFLWFEIDYDFKWFISLPLLPNYVVWFYTIILFLGLLMGGILGSFSGDFFNALRGRRGDSGENL